MKKKTVKEVKMHKFLVFACKSQDFAQIQKNFARSHDRMTVTFRNSAYQTLWFMPEFLNIALINLDAFAYRMVYVVKVAE